MTTKKAVRVMTSVKMPVALMGAGRDLTTGQVARVCGVSEKTAKEWMDRGEIPGSYKLPNSRDRRVSRENLVQFMVKEGIGQRVPKEWRRSAVLIDLSDKVAESLIQVLANAGLSVVRRNDDLSVLGLLAVSWPELVIVGTSFGKREIASIIPSVRSGGEDRRVFVVAVSGADEDLTPDGISRTAFGVDRAIGYWKLLDGKSATEEVNSWITEAADRRC